MQWINEFGFVTIPTLAGTASALIIVLLSFALFAPAEIEVGGRQRESSTPGA